MKKSKPPTYHLRIRSYPHGRFVSAWVIQREGSEIVVESGVLFGELLPGVADELATALGIEVEREASPWDAAPLPLTAENLTLFSEGAK